jgi:hypothetical protein
MLPISLAFPSTAICPSSLLEMVAGLLPRTTELANCAYVTGRLLSTPDASSASTSRGLCIK